MLPCPICGFEGGPHATECPDVPVTDSLNVGDYVFREAGPRGDDEGVIIRLRQYTATIYSYVHDDHIVYPRAAVTTEQH